MRNIMLLVLVAVLAIGLLTVNGCGPESRADARKVSPKSEPVLVRTVPVEHTNADLPVKTVGKLEAKEELRLSFKIGGIIDKISVDEGENVEKGQLLASLSLTEIDAQLNQAQNGFDKADRDLQRVKNLFADTVATLEQLQNAKTAWEVAKAGLDAAAFNRKYAQIYAPCNGRILRRMADDHEQVSSGTPILVMAGFEKGWVVRAGLVDRDIMRVKTGDTASIEFDALPGEAITGVISEMGAAPNPMNGTYEIEIRVGASSERLVTGLIGKITITPDAKEPMSVIPVEALVEADGTRGFVFAPGSDESTARKVPVTVSYVHEGKVGISGDLPGINEVITAGADKLTDGAIISVVK